MQESLSSQNLLFVTASWTPPTLIELILPSMALDFSSQEYVGMMMVSTLFNSPATSSSFLARRQGALSISVNGLICTMEWDFFTGAWSSERDGYELLTFSGGFFLSGLGGGGGWWGGGIGRELPFIGALLSLLNPLVLSVPYKAFCDWLFFVVGDLLSTVGFGSGGGLCTSHRASSSVFRDSTWRSASNLNDSSKESRDTTWPGKVPLSPLWELKVLFLSGVVWRLSGPLLLLLLTLRGLTPRTLAFLRAMESFEYSFLAFMHVDDHCVWSASMSFIICSCGRSGKDWMLPSGEWCCISFNDAFIDLMVAWRCLSWSKKSCSKAEKKQWIIMIIKRWPAFCH